MSLVEDYLAKSTWRIRENANFNYSYSGLLSYIANSYLAEFALRTMPPEAAEAHRSGDIHIHNLESGSLIPYCHGGSLFNLIKVGIRSPTVSSNPAKHFSAIVDHIANYFLISQNEFSGAQAFADFDTLTAPFVAYDHLDFKETKQCLQKLVFNLNFTSRQSFQSPFTNLTFNLGCPKSLAEEKAVIGGVETQDTYADFQDEVELINMAMAEIYMDRDAAGRPFTFPIPTVNVTRSFPWGSEAADRIFEAEAKVGSYYFMNYVGSGIEENTVRSMCCRLLIDTTQLAPPGGLFVAREGTGSLGVVTINMGRVGFLARDERDYFERLDRLLELAKMQLMFKAEMIDRSFKNGLLPFAEMYGFCPESYFRTIGLVGLNESCVNFLGLPLSKSVDFVEKVLLHVREVLRRFQAETGKPFNLEETPAEGSCHRLALLDRKRFDGIFTQGTVDAPYYTSVLVPTVEEISLIERMNVEERLLPLFTGGTVFRILLGEAPGASAAKRLVRRIVENTRIPYLDLGAVLSVCPKDRTMLYGVKETCDLCHGRTEIYARVVGYYRPTYKWNPGKQREFADRRYYGMEALNNAASEISGFRGAQNNHPVKVSVVPSPA
ncbi:MAG: ribonucleoside triphosphate reductase [Candidatus Bathyarchaeia archaeon]